MNARSLAGALPLGATLGPYHIVASLRSGGMASLHLASRRGPAGFARPVALKVIHAHLANDPDFVRMFLDEAVLGARIRHPNVVHIEELGEHEGTYFLAMEYVDGCTLSDLLVHLARHGERLPVAEAVHIACAVLEGLHAAHGLCGDAGEPLEVVHRDVSPSNIMLDRTGHVKLIDFGVARARGRAVETRAGTLKGKYAYMSPEQALGQPLDHRSDLYSLGVVLWEMLTMRRLFVADEELAILSLVQRPSLPRLEDEAPQLGAALVRVLERALSTQPEARHEDARSLRKALLAAVPESRNIDPGELCAAIERTVGPGQTTRFDVPGMFTATTPAATGNGEAPAHEPASSVVSRRRRTPLILASLLVLVACALVYLLRAPAAPAPARLRSVGAEEPMPTRRGPIATSIPSAPGLVRKATSGRGQLPKPGVRPREAPRAEPARSLEQVAQPGVPMVEQPDF